MTYIVADVFDGLATLEASSVDLIVTSPPFGWLRSYLPANHPQKHLEIGHERDPAEFIDTLLEVTAELRRVLAPHGSIAIELGDTYAGSGGAGGDYLENGLREGQPTFRQSRNGEWPLAKSKCLIPESYAWALAYGRNPFTGAASPAGKWRVRNIVNWCRPNPPVGALGDKWRNATSDLIVACTSSKRYWDDLATRQPHKYPDHADRPRIGHKEAGKEGGNTANNASGAPLLDYWELSPGGWGGAHFAVFPPELVVPCVKAMCPEKVCRVCGEPSRRILSEATYEPSATYRGGSMVADSERLGENVNQWVGPNGAQASVVKQQDTLGWTDCGHGSIVCQHCNVLVPYDHAIRRPRQGAPIQSGVGEEEVLGEPVESPGGQAQASEGVRGLRSRLSGPVRDDKDLQPVLFGPVGASGGSGELDRGTRFSQPDVEGRAKDQPSGLRSDMGAAGVSGPTEGRVHDGASSGDAGTSRPSTGTLGVGSPQERDQGRQPDRELGDRESRQTSGNGDLPELRDGVSTALDGYVCPCGSTDFKYVADHWRSGRVLDPFAGTGTTLHVAESLGREAIGIDLDERNLSLYHLRSDERAFNELRQMGLPL